jgi:hypothetical protein
MIFFIVFPKPGQGVQKNNLSTPIDPFPRNYRENTEPLSAVRVEPYHKNVRKLLAFCFRLFFFYAMEGSAAVEKKPAIGCARWLGHGLKKTGFGRNSGALLDKPQVLSGVY